MARVWLNINVSMKSFNAATSAIGSFASYLQYHLIQLNRRSPERLSSESQITAEITLQADTVLLPTLKQITTVIHANRRNKISLSEANRQWRLVAEHYQNCMSATANQLIAELKSDLMVAQVVIALVKFQHSFYGVIPLLTALMGQAVRLRVPTSLSWHHFGVMKNGIAPSAYHTGTALEMVSYQIEPEQCRQYAMSFPKSLASIDFTVFSSKQITELICQILASFCSVPGVNEAQLKAGNEVNLKKGLQTLATRPDLTCEQVQQIAMAVRIIDFDWHIDKSSPAEIILRQQHLTIIMNGLAKINERYHFTPKSAYAIVLAFINDIDLWFDDIESWLYQQYLTLNDEQKACLLMDCMRLYDQGGISQRPQLRELLRVQKKAASPQAGDRLTLNMTRLFTMITHHNQFNPSPRHIAHCANLFCAKAALGEMIFSYFTPWLVGCCQNKDQHPQLIEFLQAITHPEAVKACRALLLMTPAWQSDIAVVKTILLNPCFTAVLTETPVTEAGVVKNNTLFRLLLPGLRTLPTLFWQQHLNTLPTILARRLLNDEPLRTKIATDDNLKKSCIKNQFDPALSLRWIESITWTADELFPLLSRCRDAAVVSAIRQQLLALPLAHLVDYFISLGSLSSQQFQEILKPMISRLQKEKQCFVIQSELSRLVIAMPDHPQLITSWLSQMKTVRYLSNAALLRVAEKLPFADFEKCLPMQADSELKRLSETLPINQYQRLAAVYQERLQRMLVDGTARQQARKLLHEAPATHNLTVLGVLLTQSTMKSLMQELLTVETILAFCEATTLPDDIIKKVIDDFAVKQGLIDLDFLLRFCQLDAGLTLSRCEIVYAAYMKTHPHFHPSDQFSQHENKKPHHESEASWQAKLARAKLVSIIFVKVAVSERRIKDILCNCRYVALPHLMTAGGKGILSQEYFPTICRFIQQDEALDRQRYVDLVKKNPKMSPVVLRDLMPSGVITAEDIIFLLLSVPGLSSDNKQLLCDRLVKMLRLDSVESVLDTLSQFAFTRGEYARELNDMPSSPIGAARDYRRSPQKRMQKSHQQKLMQVVFEVLAKTRPDCIAKMANDHHHATMQIRAELHPHWSVGNFTYVNQSWINSLERYQNVKLQIKMAAQAERGILFIDGNDKYFDPINQGPAHYHYNIAERNKLNHPP